MFNKLFEYQYKFQTLGEVVALELRTFTFMKKRVGYIESG